MQTPILDAHLAAKTIWTDGYSFFCRAADGMELSIGVVLKPRDRMQIESWLRDYPTPDTW